MDRFYIDYRLTNLRGKRFSNTESNGGKYLNVKYLLPEKSTFRSNGYVFGSLQSYSYMANDPYGNGNNFTPQGYENYKFGKNHFRIFKVGIGLMIH